MKNTRAQVEKIIQGVEALELSEPLIVIDTEFLDRCLITGIQDGMLVGNQIWDDQTGDSVELALSNVDLDSLIFIAQYITENFESYVQNLPE